MKSNYVVVYYEDNGFVVLFFDTERRMQSSRKYMQSDVFEPTFSAFDDCKQWCVEGILPPKNITLTT